MEEIALRRVRIDDPFWSPRIAMVRDVMIPYQWDALNDRVPAVAPSGAVRNFEIAAGVREGTYQGLVFQDSDLYKWIEAAACSLEISPNPMLDSTLDKVAALLAKAQQADGYLNTYFTVKEPEKRWTNLQECHELYCAGHLFEAAAAHFQATGKNSLLRIACRFADHIDRVFGRMENQLRGYPGHQEVELGLLKLYRCTGERRYFELARYFLAERGREPYYFDLEWERRGRTEHFRNSRSRGRKYAQTHRIVVEQTEAVGHAVRATYMYAAMAEVATETRDMELSHACRLLWDNVVSGHLYLTGALGSSADGEAFTISHDLPNDTAYAETCASVGLMFWARRMLALSPEGSVADVMEHALYNCLLGSMSMEARRFFYVNPLEVVPSLCTVRQDLAHVRVERQGWFPCACCPPNFARLLMSLGYYIYRSCLDSVDVNLYIGSEVELDVAGGVRIRQRTCYPWDGSVRFELSPALAEAELALRVRIPGWCRTPLLRVNGSTVELSSVQANGYATLRRSWRRGDTVELQLPMPVERVYGNGLVREDAGKVAIKRGPIVYCLEEADNGRDLHTIMLPRDAELDVGSFNPALLGGVIPVRTRGFRQQSTSDQALYSTKLPVVRPVALTAIPYFAWGNRGAGEMRVWIREGA